MLRRGKALVGGPPSRLLRLVSVSGFVACRHLGRRFFSFLLTDMAPRPLPGGHAAPASSIRI
jgi:hypothetical protein